jgi:hypothetical protein
MWPDAATHPYNFELRDAAGALAAVFDVKTTGGLWLADFYMSKSEVAYAAQSEVPYYVYRVSELGKAGAWLRRSDDVRVFAKMVDTAFTHAAPPGTRLIAMALGPADSGITWGEAIRLDPVVPAAPPVDLEPEEEATERGS